MAKRGPKRLPTKILKLRGSRRAEDRPKNEPKPVKGLPKPPDWLNNVARKEWFKLVGLLSKQGCLALIDSNALGLLCDCLSDFLSVKKLCEDKKGKPVVLIKTTNKNIILSPAFCAKRTLRNEMSKLFAEFGMTPSSRAGINLPESPKDETDTAQQWINQQKGA